MIYNDYLNRLTTALPIDDPTEANWVIFLPQIIQDAENMVYRDLDPLVMRKTTTGTLSGGVNTLTLPSDWLIGRELFVTTGGVQSRVRRCEDSYLDIYAPSGQAGSPRYWAQPTFGSLTFQPTTDTSYTYKAYYTGLPVPLSATNATTWLTLYVPDLFFAASMIFATGYQKNWGAMSEDPRASLSWDIIYQRELASAIRAEGRRKGEGYMDQTLSPPPSSTASR